MSKGHIPIRMCAVTNEKLPKKELLRFVFVLEEGLVKLDEGERIRGRGLNMKPDIKVFDEGIKRKIFKRIFNTNLTDLQLKQLRNIVEESINRRFVPKKTVRISKEKLDNLKVKGNEK